MERLARDYLPPDLVKTTQPHNITGSVAVQARQSIQETEWLLEHADRSPIYTWRCWLGRSQKPLSRRGPREVF